MGEADEVFGVCVEHYPTALWVLATGFRKNEYGGEGF